MIVDESGLKRRPAIPDTRAEGASFACSVSPGKEGPRGWILLVCAEVVGGAGVEAGAAAGAVVVVVVVDDVDAGEDWAVFIRTFPAAALILFIGT